MILTCPSCGTQYAVKDGAIPPQGRKVRCASCGESWFQEAERAADSELDSQRAAEVEEAAGIDGPSEGPVDIDVVVEDGAVEQDSPYDTIPEPVRDDDEDESFAEAALIEHRTGPEAEERAFEESVLDDAPPAEAGDWREPPEPDAQDDHFPVFDASEEDEPPRRRGLGLLIALLVVAALAALFWFFAPDEWKSRLGIAAHASPLELVTTHMDRQQLESGNELLTVTGRVINPTGKDQSVPPLTAELRTKAGKVVYRWTIAPPARILSPGASASFNSAEVNVPPGGDQITITLGDRAA